MINASDDAVIASGEAVDAVLGTKKKPAKGAPNYALAPSGKAANSNSAAYAVADRLTPRKLRLYQKKVKIQGRNNIEISRERVQE